MAPQLNRPTFRMNLLVDAWERRFDPKQKPAPNKAPPFAAVPSGGVSVLRLAEPRIRRNTFFDFVRFRGT